MTPRPATRGRRPSTCRCSSTPYADMLREGRLRAALFRSGGLYGARVDRPVGCAEDERDLSRGRALRARDVARDRRSQLHDDVVGTVDGGVRRTLVRKRLLYLLLRHRSRKLDGPWLQRVGEGRGPGLRDLGLARGAVAEGHVAGERRALLGLDVIRALGALDVRRRRREVALDPLLDLRRVDRLVGTATARHHERHHGCERRPSALVERVHSRTVAEWPRRRITPFG